MSIWSEIKRRNVLKVGAAYLVAAWLLVQIAATVAPQLQLPEWAPRLITLLLMLGFPIALLIAWFLEHTPEGLKVEPAAAGNKRMVGVAIALVALAVGWYLREVREMGSESLSGREPVADARGIAPESDSDPLVVPADPKSIAVLPFVNMSSDPEQEFFADGLSEEILNSLARIDGMRVVGRTSSFQFKGKAEDLRAVGAKLGVASVLEGSVRRGKDTARITAQLIRVSDGVHVWSQTYDRALDDVLAVQLDIAENVAGILDVVLDDGQRERMRAAGVRSVDAFVAFQKGRSLFEDAHNPSRTVDMIATLRLANAEFARATALEPDLEVAHYLASDLHTHILESERATEAERTEALAAAIRALDLAARSAQDPGQRLSIEVSRQLLSDDWRGLADRFREASERQGCAESVWLLVGSPFGLARERLAAGRRRIACDPLASSAQFSTVNAALWAGEPQQALDLIAWIRQATGTPGAQAAAEIQALVALGRLDEARARLPMLAPGTPESAAGQLLIAAATGADVSAIAARSHDERKVVWLPERWRSVDTRAAVLTGDRAQANRIAATLDASPGGPWRVAVLVASCTCGAPFDLDATPNFKARLAESGLSWPPPDLLADLRRERPPAP